MVEKRPFIDAPIPPRKSSGALLSGLSDRGTATFIEDLGNGNAAAFYPVGSENRVVAPRESGWYSAGSLCQVLLGGDGRVVRIFPPETIGEDAESYGPGAVVVDQLDLELEAARARLDAAMAKLALDLEAAQKDIDESQEHANEVAAELEKQRDEVTTALNKAFAAEGGIAGALENVAKLEAELAPKLAAAQEKANQVAANMEVEKARILTAHNAAMNAQSIADDAIRQAATAAGVAAGKGDVLIQGATPAAAMRLATTLWIDTTGGANTPKRWNGSAWVAVTDKAASDAAAAAAKAASDAALAMTTADGKNKIFYQSTTPTGAKAGDRWYNSTSGKAQVWTGSAWRDTTPGEGFVPALDIGRATVGDMEVGRLKAANSTFGTAVIDKLVADQAFLDRLAVKSSIVVGTADNLFPGMWNDKEGAGRWPTGISWTTGSGWVPTGLTGCLKTVAGQSTTAAPDTQVEVTPGEEILFELWLRTASGDAVGSNIYVELRDQANALLPTASWSGGPTTGSYMITNLQVPNAWKKYSVTLKVPTGVSKIGGLRFYFNHTNGTNKNASIGFAMRAQRKTGAVLIGDGAVAAQQINATSVAGAVGEFVKVKAGNLVADNAAMNAAFIKQLVGDSAFFNSMLTNQLVISPGNMLKDTSFDKKWWPGSSPYTILPTGGYTGGPAARFGPSETQQGVVVAATYGNSNPALTSDAVPGTKVRVSVWVKSSTAIPANGVGAYVVCWNNTGGTASRGGNWTKAIPANTWTEISAEAQLATNETRIAGYFISRAVDATGNTDFSDPRVSQMTGAVLIEDGAITAPKIKTGEIKAEHITVTKELSGNIAKFLDITTDMLTAGKVKITDELIADEISGKVLQTGKTAARLRLGPGGGSGNLSNYPNLTILDNNSKRIAELVVDASQTKNPVHANLIFYNASGVERASLKQKVGETGYRFILRDEKGVERVAIDDAAAEGIKVTNPGSGRFAWITGGKIQSTGVYNNSTTLAGNIHCDQYGVFYRSTSVAAAKTDIRPLPLDPRILDVEVVDWIDRGSQERQADALEYAAQLREGLIGQEKYETRTQTLPDPSARLPRIPGVIAEQIESLGLTEFCIYNDDGELTGVQYERLSLLLIPIVKDHHPRIKALEKETAELKAALAALTTRLNQAGL